MALSALRCRTRIDLVSCYDDTNALVAVEVEAALDWNRISDVDRNNMDCDEDYRDARVGWR